MGLKVGVRVGERVGLNVGNNCWSMKKDISSEEKLVEMEKISKPSHL